MAAAANGNSGGKKAPVIDIHAHLSPAAPEELIAPHRTLDPPSRAGGGLSDQSRAVVLSDVAARIADMDSLGIDMTALTPGPDTNFYREPAAAGLAIARAINDNVAELVSQHPTRLIGLGVLPLQDAANSVAEMARGVRDLDLRGFRISTNIDGMELDDPSLEDVYSAAEEMDTLLFTHPQGFTQPQRLGEFHLNNVIGNPLESTLTVTRLIFGGVLERHPRLKVFISHGGGYFPFYFGRFDHAWEERADCRANISRPPSEYIRQLYFDTVVFKPEMVAFLTQMVGVDKVMMGTDRPYDMGENDPLGLVAEVPGLSDADRQAILGGNAATLLKLS